MCVGPTTILSEQILCDDVFLCGRWTWKWKPNIIILRFTSIQDSHYSSSGCQSEEIIQNVVPSTVGKEHENEAYKGRFAESEAFSGEWATPQCIDVGD